jgi:hypothetical protein
MAAPQPTNLVDKALETAHEWARINETSFFSKPILVVGNNVVTVHWKMDESTLKNIGVKFFTHNSNLYTRYVITKAYITGYNESSQETASYPGAASIFQASIDSAIGQGDLTSNGAISWTYNVADLDSITGLTGYKKTVDVRIEFMNKVART